MGFVEKRPPDLNLDCRQSVTNLGWPLKSISIVTTCNCYTPIHLPALGTLTVAVIFDIISRSLTENSQLSVVFFQ